MMRDAPVHTCSSCRQVLTPQARESESFTWPTILHNASNGCQLFQWFKRRIEQIYDVGPLAERRRWLSRPITEQSISLSRFTDPQHHADENEEPQYDMERVYVNFEDGTIGQNHIGETLIVQALEGSVAAKYIKSRPYVYEREPQSPLWKKWIDDCNSNHPDCLPDRFVTPSRLIHISASNITNPNICLYTVAEGEMPQYAALSYSWGGDQTFKTTQSRLHEYQSSISWVSLQPYRTITDAIRATYSLGLRYLWVDALCIVQDDDADKAHELGRMGSIYAGANITIRASMCSTSRDAFTSARPWHGELPICETLMPINEGMSVPVQLLQSPEPDGLREPIDSRAWCFQELLLARRTLNFDSRFVWWKCPVCVRTDGGPASLSPGGISWLELGGKGNKPLRHYDPDEALEKWMECVLDYQKRRLTVDADKLPAIAAIAEYLNKYIPGGYLAGLWVYKLPLQLLWHVVPKGPPTVLCPRPHYRAPSWSWASVNDTGIVLSMTQVSGEILLEVVSYSSTATFGDTPFGAVNSASITVRGRLKQVRLTRGFVVRSLVTPKATSDSHPMYPDSGFDHNFQFDSEDDKAYFENAVSIFMLEVAVSDDGGVSGLLLSPKVERSYKRVGTFYIPTSEIKYIDESVYERRYSGTHSEMCLPVIHHFRGELSEEQPQGRETADIPLNNIKEPSKVLSEEDCHSNQMSAFEVPSGYHGDDEEEPLDQESFTPEALSEQIQDFQTLPSGSGDVASSEWSDGWDPELVPGLEFFAGLAKIEIVLI